jgi:hypothetical protein
MNFNFGYILAQVGVTDKELFDDWSALHRLSSILNDILVMQQLKRTKYCGGNLISDDKWSLRERSESLRCVSMPFRNRFWSPCWCFG